MKEINNQEMLNHYLHAHQIESVFNDRLKPYLSLYKMNEGELICSQGEPSDYLFVLVKGKVKIYTTSVEGKTLILSFKTPLDLIGDIEYIRETERMNTVEAVSPVYLIGIHYRWLRIHGKDDISLHKFLLEIITQKFYIKSNTLSFNLMYPVEVRLASYILSVSFDESNLQFEGKISTSSLADAADLLGTSYRHLNRVIQQFCLEGLIERSKGFITVKDKERLSERANENIYK
ncbi:cyclic nucleotide-binding domain-containing protein [Bacillus spongiae]|uniref:Cyclic nucleotide-binding domain-containing protein n=1 Tax=Bacillus spongiae TaxID=2683610 RepID=A0ABU8HCJ6_9BACI